MIMVSWISYPIVRSRDDNIGMTRRRQHKVVICWFDKAEVLVYNPTDITTSVGNVSSDSTSEHKVRIALNEHLTETKENLGGAGPSWDSHTPLGRINYVNVGREVS